MKLINTLLILLILMINLLVVTMSASSSPSPTPLSYSLRAFTKDGVLCSECARLKMIGCLYGVCHYRCYRRCMNGTHKYVGQ